MVGGPWLRLNSQKAILPTTTTRPASIQNYGDVMPHKLQLDLSSKTINNKVNNKACGLLYCRRSVDCTVLQ